MSRAIDGDALFCKFWRLADPFVKQDKVFPSQIWNQAATMAWEAPTLTPPNKWVSVEDEIPSDDDDGLEFFCMTNATRKCGGVLPLEWEVATIRGKTVRRWKWRSRISPWAVTHWMKRPAPPGENNNVPTKAPNEPLPLEQLREMDGKPVWLDVADGVWALVDAPDECVWLDRGGNIDIYKLIGKVYRRPTERQEDT